MDLLARMRILAGIPAPPPEKDGRPVPRETPGELFRRACTPARPESWDSADGAMEAMRARAGLKREEKDERIFRMFSFTRGPEMQLKGTVAVLDGKDAERRAKAAAEDLLGYDPGNTLPTRGGWECHDDGTGKAWYVRTHVRHFVDPRKEAIGEGLGSGPDDSAEIIAAIKPRLAIGDRQVKLQPFSPGLYITFINLPAGPVRDPAEAENNRLSLIVRPAAGGKYSVETSVCAIGRQWILRKKTAPLDRLGAYIAGHLSKVAAEVPPKFTHSVREAAEDKDKARLIRAIYRVFNVSDKMLRDKKHIVQLVGSHASNFGVENYTLVVLEDQAADELERLARAVGASV